MKSLKIMLFILSFIIFSAKITIASETKNEKLFLKINQTCKRYYTDDSICKCILSITKQQIRERNTFLNDNSNDSQIDTHVRGTGAVCELDVAKEKFN